MSGYLLDTDVVSELTRAAPDNGEVTLLTENEDFLLSVDDAMTTLTEVEVEQAALGWLSDLGQAVVHGPQTPQTPSAIPNPPVQSSLPASPWTAA